MLHVLATAATLALGCVAAPNTPASAAAAGGCTYQVTPPYPANLWIRSGPGTGYEPVDSAGYLETVWGSCRSRGNWVRVGSDAGVPGWAYRPYLRKMGC
jgi:uncharacterized protein YraI